MANPSVEQIDDTTQHIEDQSVSGEAWHRPFPRLARWLTVGSAVLGAVSFFFLSTIPDFTFFAVNSEMNLWTFVSVLLSIAAAASQALVGRMVGGRVGKALYVTALVLLAMAFDDFAHLHERLNVVGDALFPHLPGHLYLWVIPASVPAAVVLLAFWHLGRQLTGPARRDLLLGMGIILGAAMGLETVNGFLDRPGTDGWPLLTLTHIEEFAENLGLILLLRGSLSMMRVSWGTGLHLRIADPAFEQATSPASLERLGAESATGTSHR